MSYLRSTLHIHVRVDRSANQDRLPIYFRNIYELFDVTLGRDRLLVAGTGRVDLSVGQIATHLKEIAAITMSEPVVFASNVITPKRRTQFVADGIPFMIPGKQFYIPQLAMDLRETFRRSEASPSSKMSPAAQVVLFHRILDRDSDVMKPARMAEILHLTPMSIGRAYDELEGLGLASTSKHGREKHLRFHKSGRTLFEDALNFIRGPVRSIKYVRGVRVSDILKLAGESALAELTDVSHPRMSIYAVAATDWNGIKLSRHLNECEKEDADFTVEAWFYNPAALSSDQVVDRLSLYAQFKDARDPRLKMAADGLLERIKW